MGLLGFRRGSQKNLLPLWKPYSPTRRNKMPQVRNRYEMSRKGRATLMKCPIHKVSLSYVETYNSIKYYTGPKCKEEGDSYYWWTIDYEDLYKETKINV